MPLYPTQLTSSPINLHIHGVHVSPKGNADNVMLHIPAGMSNTYTYHIPKNMPQGAYWYHSHLHTLTTPQIYSAWRVCSRSGATDGNIPLVTRTASRSATWCCSTTTSSIGGRTRADQQSELAAMGQHDQAAGRRRAGQGHVPSAARAGEFPGIEEGNAVLHGLVSPGRWRSKTSAAASSSFRATCSASRLVPADPGSDVPADPSLPDYQRDVQFTVNGQFQPVIKSKPDRPRSGCSRMSAISPT